MNAYVILICKNYNGNKVKKNGEEDKMRCSMRRWLLSYNEGC